jgi:hypothetical protein
VEAGVYAEYRAADGGAGVVEAEDRRRRRRRGESPSVATPRGCTMRAMTADLEAGTLTRRRRAQVRPSEACATFGQRSVLVDRRLGSTLARRQKKTVLRRSEDPGVSRRPTAILSATA